MGGKVMSYIFYLVNLKLVSRPMWISNCKTVCCQRLLNMDKPMILLSNPLKYDLPLPENMVSIIIFHEIELVSTKIVNSNSLKKNQLSASVNDEHP